MSAQLRLLQSGYNVVEQNVRGLLVDAQQVAGGVFPPRPLNPDETQRVTDLIAAAIEKLDAGQPVLSSSMQGVGS